MNRDGWTEIWGELDPTGRLEQALGLLPNAYDMTPTDSHFSLTDPLYHESKPFRIEALFNRLSGQCWQVCITEITNGVYALLYRLDESEDALARKQAFMAPRYQHPDLKAIRQRAVKQLLAAIAPIAKAHQHQPGREQWVRETAWCRSRLWLQRSRGGFACYLNVDYQPRLIKWDGTVNTTRVGAFAPRQRQIDGTDSLFYVELQEISPVREVMLDLLRTRVMPYLDRCHNVLGERQRRHKPFGMMPS